MEKDTSMKTLRFNYSPMNLTLSLKRKAGLRIGYMEAFQRGFYLNSLETGVEPENISDYLLEKFNCKDASSSCESFQFLINEGDRTSYAILLPYLLSTDNLAEFETIIRERFFGIERFIQQGKNLYNFLKYVEHRKEPTVWMNDLERGIIGWDMGQLVGLVRAAREKKYITKKQAWEYINEASLLCAKSLDNPQEIDKSYLIGQAMKLHKIEDWERLILCYSLVSQSEK